MIFVFGIHKDKVKLSGLRAKHKSMMEIINSGKTPLYYVEKADILSYKIGVLEAKLSLAEGTTK